MSVSLCVLLHVLTSVSLAFVAAGQDLLTDNATNWSDENDTDDMNGSEEVPVTTTTLSTLSSTTSTTSSSSSITSSTTSSSSSITSSTTSSSTSTWSSTSPTSTTSTTETLTTETSTSQTSSVSSTTTTGSNSTTSTTTTSTYTNTSSTVTSSTATTQTTSLTSSTTTFSSTNTSTSSSSTTTRVYFLSLDVAHLTATRLTLSFNYPARWVQEPNETWGCDALFEDSTAPKLGMSPSCSLSEDMFHLQVVLGVRAHLQVGDMVALQFGVFVPAIGVYLPTELEEAATTHDAPVAVHAVLVSPDISPICARLRFSTALSTGFAGRAPSISWQLGNSTHEELGRLLQPVLSEASDSADQVLEIPPETLFAAVSMVQEEGNESEMLLEVVSTITNWHGEMDEATAVLTVLNVEEPLPQIMPAMFPELEIWPSEEVEMAVHVYPTETADFCLDSIRRSNREDTIVRQVGNESNETEVETVVEELPPEPVAPADPGVILIRWEYRRLDDGACFWVARSNASNETDNASNDSNSSANLSCPLMFWQPLDNMTFADQDRDPSTLRFPAFSFAPNSSHQFRAAAVRQDLPAGSNRSTVTYTLNVRPRSRPIVSVSGPPAASTSCAFVLRAEAWEEAGAMASAPSAGHGGGDFEYAWGCMVGVMAEMNESEVEEAERCMPRLADLWMDSPELRVEAGELQEDSYTFVARVRRRGMGSMGSPEAEVQASWTLRVGRQLRPLVALKVPWRSDQALSTSSRHVEAVADVIGSRSCPIPFWRWQWVLISSNSSVLARLRTNDTSLEEPFGNFTLSTADFRADLLMPGRRYAYALVAHDAGVLLHLENSALSELESAGAFVSWSHFFHADAPPAFGVVESVPRSGFAVSSVFTLNTFGWRDEQEDGLSYAFFRFPVENVEGMGPDAFADGMPDTDFEWKLPRTDWHNVSSPDYFQKQGGRLLRSWAKSKSVSDVAMAAGSYYLVVRARDPLGAEGLAAVLGPMVAEPWELSATAATNALKVAAASSDVHRILNAVDATLSVPVSAPFEGQLLEAMEVAASVVEPTPEALEKMSYVVSSVVQGGRTGMGLLVNKSQLTQAAAVLDSCINLALSSPEAGVGENLAVAMLQSISSVNLGGRIGQPDSPHSESVNFTFMLEALTSKLADASLARMHQGESRTLAASAAGSGTALELSRTTTSVFRGGLTYGRLRVPQKVELLARRLQSTDDPCNALDMKLTVWERSNPYSWADPSKGVNRMIFPNSTVAVLQLELCGSPVTFNDTDPDAAVEVRDIDLPPKPPPMHGFWLDPSCARWSPRDQAWVFDGVEVKQPVYYDAVKVTCMAFYGGTAYVAVWVPVEVTTSSTTLEWTYPSYTTFFVPSLPPVYVVSCNESLLPDPPAGTWACSKPGEGQECRSPCFGFPTLIFSMTCLKGADSLEWFTTNFCPEFTTTTIYERVKIPAEEAVTGGLLIFVWVVLVTCGAGVAALLSYGCYRFAQNEQKRRSSVSQAVFSESDPEEEDPVDPRFMDWAKQWAERPTIVKSAIVEMKHQASRSQDSLAIEDHGASSPENLNVPDAPSKAPGPSAFSVKVELEYSDDWREKLDALLGERDIPRHAEGRLYYIVNTVREVLQTKELETLHRVNFPLNVHMQDSNPTVEKSDAFYGWQVEWGALRQGQDPDIREPPKKEVELLPSVQQTFDVPKLPLHHQQHQDLMVKWQEQQKLRSAANPKPQQAKAAAGSEASLSPLRLVDPVQQVLDRYQASGHVTSTERFGGALADTAAQASVLVPELQASYYEDQYDADEGWLEVRSPSGRIYYWNQITQEVWDPPEEEEEFLPDPSSESAH